MFNLFKKKKHYNNPMDSIPQGWMVRQISQDPLDGTWMGILFKLEPTYDGGCPYVEAIGLCSFEALIQTLVHRIESGKGIKNTKYDQ